MQAGGFLGTPIPFPHFYTNTQLFELPLLSLLVHRRHLAIDRARFFDRRAVFSNDKNAESFRVDPSTTVSKGNLIEHLIAVETFTTIGIESQAKQLGRKIN